MYLEAEQAYNIWAKQYDTNSNKTRDLEARAFRETLANRFFDNCLEIGCGTGKNTQWLLTKCQEIVSIDLSEEMLRIAKQKITSSNVTFIKADVSEDWKFARQKYNLVVFSLVLEHIENLDHIFNEASKSTNIGAYIYLGELHPFKQYNGTKARFETESGLQIVKCFNHHISDFVIVAKKYNFDIKEFREYFDDDDKTQIPRILSILFQKSI